MAQVPKRSSTGFTSKSPSSTNLLLGRYKIGKLLSSRSAPEPWRRKSRQGRAFALIKVLDKEKFMKGGLMAHIKREISILRRVRHPNIVQLFEIMATKAKIYFVMEYVCGGQLLRKVFKGRLKEEVRKYFHHLYSYHIISER